MKHLRQAYTTERLRDLDALLLGDSFAQVDAKPEEAEVVARWVHGGGVFLVNPLVWVAESYGKKPAHSVNVNVLTRLMGLYFAPDYLSNDAPVRGAPTKENDIVFTSATFASHPLLEGVSTLGLNGVPGSISIEKGHALVWGSDRKRGPGFEKQPLLVQVPYGGGYVIGYQHEGLFGEDTLAGRNLPGGMAYDNGRLWRNLVDFIAQRRTARSAARGRCGDEGGRGCGSS